MSGESRKILLVEDNPVDTLCVCKILSDTEEFLAQLECSDCLASACDLLQADHGFDLIVLDLGLPDSNALETFRKIHAQAPDVPVIILSGMDDAQTAMQILREGAEDYLVKGDLSSALLIRSMRHAVERHRTRDELRKSEASLRQSERFLTNVLASIQDGITILDTDFNILRVNPRLEAIMAHAAPLVGKKCFEAFHNRTSPCSVCPANETLKMGAPSGAIIPVSACNGVTWVEINTFPLVDAETGKIEGVVEHGRDVTERRQVEEALRESEERYRTLFDQSKDGVYITTRDGRLTEANEAYLNLFGFSRSETRDLDILRIYPEPAAENRQRFREAIEKTGSVKDYELKLKTKDGRLIDCL